MSDTLAIASTIADRFRGLTTPSGQPALVEASHLLPVGIPGLPALYVFPPDSQTLGERLFNGIRRENLSFPVRFYLVQEPSDGPDELALHGWRAALQDRILTNYQLGMPTSVTGAWIDSIQPALLEYAGKEHLGLDLVVKVGTWDVIHPSA